MFKINIFVKIRDGLDVKEGSAEYVLMNAKNESYCSQLTDD